MGIFAGLAAVALLLAGCSPQPAPLTIVPVGSTARVLRQLEPYAALELLGWGPGWSWTGWEGGFRGDRVQATLRLNTGATLRLSGRVHQEGRNLRIETETTSDKDTELTLAALAVSFDRTAFQGGTFKAGSVTNPLPVGVLGVGDRIGSFEATDAQGRRLAVRLDPPCPVSADGSVRIALASGRVSAGEVNRQSISITFGEELGKVDPDLVKPEEGWFEWKPDPAAQGVDEVSLAQWLDAPAGKHGRIVAKGERLEVNDKPIRLWGINLCYQDCAPPKDLAERRAAFYARNGINAVRLHKYADGPGWAGIQSPESFTEFDPEALDRMDYFVAQLKAKGIYVKLSPTFGVKLGPKDYDQLPFAKDFGPRPAPGNRLETKHGAVYLSTEIQNLQIRQTTNLLKHRNPYTGLTYAEDPAIFLVEMYNEDSALFYGTMERLQNVPALRAKAGVEFVHWLRDKYKTKEALLARWGADSLNTFAGERITGESWEDWRIFPVGNPWFFDPDQLAGSQAARAPRLHDTMQFLYELQNRFYHLFISALGQVGYRGEAMASNWIAGRAFSHFYNLHSDAQIGLVDRHNYYGGGEGGTIQTQSMLVAPGSGLLSTGLSQVAGRPFSLSEWIHVFPTEWGVEGPAILGAYGMGLQGWDVSFIFQNRDSGTWSERIGRDQWDATAPQILGVFPAVARQVLRGDVKTSPVTHARKVHIPSLAKGELGFDDRADAQGDVKTSDSRTFPAAGLAMVRSMVEFTDKPEPTASFDVRPFYKDGRVVSSTGELRWGYGEGKGWIEIDTAGTQALVGFAAGREIRLGQVSITTRTPFCAVYVSARGKDESLSSAKSALITTIARARNTGMKVLGPLLLDAGKPPVVLEPVVAEVDLRRPGATVHILDSEGRRTGRTATVKGTKVLLDGTRDRTWHYLAVWP